MHAQQHRQVERALRVPGHPPQPGEGGWFVVHPAGFHGVLETL